MNIVAGYFSNPEATTSTLDSEGWLRTGDLCYIDDDGFIFIVDRLKELIKYKGYQVNETLCIQFFNITLFVNFFFLIMSCKYDTVMLICMQCS